MHACNCSLDPEVGKELLKEHMINETRMYTWKRRTKFTFLKYCVWHIFIHIEALITHKRHIQKRNSPKNQNTTWRIKSTYLFKTEGGGDSRWSSITPSHKQLIAWSKRPFLETNFFLRFLVRLSGNNRSRVISMGDFGPTASNFCYDF